jgi:hypothetical protein
MTAKPSTYRVIGITLLLAAFLVPASAHAIEVKKSLNMGGGGGGASGGGGPAMQGPAPKNPLSNAQQKALFDTVANDSDQFLAQESEKKSSGEPYVDLEKAQFSYMPKGGGNVEATLTGPEMKAKKSDPSKSSPTGNKKQLVFEYKADGSKFTSTKPPEWKDVAADKDKAAAKK